MSHLTPIPALLVLLGQVSGVPADHVSITEERLTELGARPEPEPELTWVQRRELELGVEPEGVTLTGRWVILGRGPASERYFLAPLLPAAARVEAATWNGKPASLWTSEDSLTVAGRVGDRAVLEVRAFLPGKLASGIPLEVLGASSGTVKVDPKVPATLTATDGSPVLKQGPLHVTGTPGLLLSEHLPAPSEHGTVAVGRVALGLTVGDDVATGFAQLAWLVRRGELAQVAFRVANVGADLDVSGANVKGFTRVGDRVEVELKAPATSAVWVQLSFTTPIPSGAETSLPLPELLPEDVLGTETTLELARAGEVDAVPALPEWTAIAPQELPAWSHGLIRGAATAAYRRTDATPAPSSRLDLFRFEPVSGPEVVVDIADLTIVTSANGRSLLRARYELTNERADSLELTPPAGAQLVGAWVAGQPAVVAEHDGRLRIPLSRSIETVDGRLGFPVMVAFVSESRDWARRERREVALPRVHAPINVERVTLRLPRGYRSRLEPGDDPVVSAFTRGNEVAYGLRDEDRIATADVIYRDALDAWNTNDFERARQRLGELEQIGAQSQNQEGLESNVILLTGPLAGAPAVSAKKRSSDGLTTRDKQERRIRAQAKARAGDASARQRAYKQNAQALRAEGRYEDAAAEYEKAIEETELLRNMDAAENQQFDFEADQLESERAAVEAEAQNRVMLEAKLWSGGPFTTSSPRRPAPPLSAVSPLVVPVTGEVVLYQLSLLEPGAARSVPIHARQHPERSRRKDSYR